MGGYSDQVTIAVVIPTYKHPGLLVEAIESVLRQSASPTCATVLIVDGCPFPETDEVCTQYAVANSDRVFHLRTRHRGLSAARNTGINFALAAFPQLEGVYLLDSDNVIGPRAIEKFYTALRMAPPEVGWIYPDIDKFGMEELAEVGGRYSVLAHLCWNFCEAGSLIRADVLRTGIRFDPIMIHGYEDWEFWLQCIEAGYRGQHLPASGFRYRQRPESMLKEAQREHPALLAFIKRKHAGLFSVRNLLHLETEEHRFLLHIRDQGEFFSLSAPDGERRRLDHLELAARVAQALVRPGFHKLPPLLVAINSATLLVLSSNKLLAWALWDLQRQISAGAIVAASILEAESATAMNNLAHVMMLPTIALIDCLGKTGPVGTPPARRILVGLPTLPVLEENFSPEQAVFTGAARMVGLRVRQPDGPQRQRMRIAAPAAYAKLVCNVHDVLPISKTNVSDIAVVFPPSGDDREEIAAAIVRRLIITGARVHCCIPSGYPLSSFIAAEAATVNILELQESGEVQRYFGTPLLTPRPNESGAGIGLFCGMDAVVNAGSPEVDALAGELRQMRVRTIAIQQASGSASDAYRLLALEHVYDGLIVPSRHLRNRFVGMGVPADKIFVFDNEIGQDHDIREQEKVLMNLLQIKEPNL